MHDQTPYPAELVLSGLDGANPLAFLAALGTLWITSRTWPDRTVRLGWTVTGGAWRPYLSIDPAVTDEELADAVLAGVPTEEELFDEELRSRSEEVGPKNKKNESKWRDKLRFPQDIFRERALARARVARVDTRDEVDYLAAWASDGAIDVVDGFDTARRTRFDFTAGQQSFIAMVRDLLESITPDKIQHALFGPWRYYPGGASMRWDPIDEARQYALQAVDPTDGSNNPILAVPGANALALVGLAFFPLVPRGSAVEQPGFDRSADGRSFRWPIWTPALGKDAVRSLLCLEELGRTPLHRDELRERGIEVVYRSWIVQPSGRYRNFTPAEAV